jgi:hypothetical protein
VLLDQRLVQRAVFFRRGLARENVARFEPERIENGYRVRIRVLVRVQPTLQPDRIRLRISPRCRVIVSEVVVVLRDAGSWTLLLTDFAPTDGKGILACAWRTGVEKLHGR